MKTLRKVREINHKLDVQYRDHWKTPLGDIILADLKTRFWPNKITTDNPHTTAMNARGVEFIDYIQRRIEDGMDGKSA